MFFAYLSVGVVVSLRDAEPWIGHHKVSERLAEAKKNHILYWKSSNILNDLRLLPQLGLWICVNETVNSVEYGKITQYKITG